MESKLPAPRPDKDKAANPMDANPMAAALGRPDGGDDRGLQKYFAKKSPDPASGAFASKFTVHAGTVGKSLAGAEAAEEFSKLLDNWGREPTGVYLHVPFCQNRCLYCGFAGRGPRPDLLDRYADALAGEIKFLASRLPADPGPVRTVYFGGGTPTVLSPAQLEKITSSLQKYLPLANDLEMTLEGRVGDLSPEKVAGFLGCGINRFSLGVQSFNGKIRKSLGRHNEGTEAARLLGNLIKPQKAAVIVDLIYGLPGQTVEDFLADVRLADQIGVDGLDTYQLNTFPGGELEKAVQKGRLDPPAPLAEQGKYYLAAFDLLKDLRWRDLSLSHYARDTRERNIYNPWAKTRGTCLAVGAGAGGFLADHATYRLPDAENYLDNAEKGLFAPDFVTSPDGRETATRLIVGQVERGWLRLEELFALPDVSRENVELLCRDYAGAGLVEISGDRLDLTPAGRFWGVNITQALVVAATDKATR
ncbi:MAG: heme anaerobic degradation radical SAM methyltransferase ChuW/HutW [Deltaproteobacteria bacterium]|nr:heme anaerobic degradation radical SAM methyltransferase ChuW/HutW [Deltaproteobacteria bacterium]